MSDTLKGIDTDHLDRQPVERFFRVRERRALQIMIRALAKRSLDCHHNLLESSNAVAEYSSCCSDGPTDDRSPTAASPLNFKRSCDRQLVQLLAAKVLLYNVLKEGSTDRFDLRGGRLSLAAYER